MSKYSVAKSAIETALAEGAKENLLAEDVLEALLVSVVAELKNKVEGDSLRSIVQYELDNIGSGGTYEIQRR